MNQTKSLRQIFRLYFFDSFLSCEKLKILLYLFDLQPFIFAYLSRAFLILPRVCKPIGAIQFIEKRF